MNIKRFKALRKEKGYTQAELAKVLGIGASAVGEYETGRNIPPLKRLEKIAELFGVSIDYLNGNTDERLTMEKKNNGDIAEELERMIEELEGNEKRMFQGKELDEATHSILIQSLKNSLAIAKTIQK